MSEMWMPPEGYRPVLDMLRGGYWPGFDRNRTYTFLRVGSNSPSAFKLADQSPLFNVAGLYFRGLPEGISA